MASTQFGGRGYVRDIPARNTTGAAVTAGDVLMLDFDTERDGFSAITPVQTNGKDYQLAIGVVVGRVGQTFRDDEDLFLRTFGKISAKVESTQDIVAEDVLFVSAGNGYFVTVATQPDLGATVSATAAAPAALTAAAPAALTAAAPAALTSTATFNSMTYTSTESDALRADVLAVRAEVVKLVTDIAAMRTPIAANVVDVAAMRTPIAALQVDGAANWVILEDIKETGGNRAAAIALAGRTDNDSGLIDIFLFGARG